MQVPGTEPSAPIGSLSAPQLVAEGDRGGDATPTPGAASQVEIAAFAGSLRAASWARSLLRSTAEFLPANVRLAIWDDLGAVPPFNEDLESGPTPLAVADLRELIQSSDALLIVTPEYNNSIPGVLKNALDWASRPYGQTVLKNKLVALVGTSPLPTGGASALADVENVLTLLGAEVVEADLAIGQVHTRIDAEGRISDLQLALRITELLVKIAHRVRVPTPATADA
jgi:chromate reductase, NAD(P)H dehydrogenase (quinone)